LIQKSLLAELNKLIWKIQIYFLLSGTKNVFPHNICLFRESKNSSIIKTKKSKEKKDFSFTSKIVLSEKERGGRSYFVIRYWLSVYLWNQTKESTNPDKWSQIISKLGLSSAD